MAIDVRRTLDFGGTARATNLPTPAAAQEAATKGYVDGLIPKGYTLDVTFGTSALRSRVQVVVGLPGITPGQRAVAAFSAENVDTANWADELEMDAHTITAYVSAVDQLTLQMISSFPTTGPRRVVLLIG